MQCYQSNLDDRDLEIEELHTKIIELSEARVLLKCDRDKFLEQRNKEADISYELAEQVRGMNAEMEETCQENLEIRQICTELHAQVFILLSSWDFYCFSSHLIKL